jgi:di/tricarboxylate transporter
MTVEAYLVLGVVLLVLLLLALTRLAADVVLMGGLTLLMVLPVPKDGTWKLGILSTGDALAGFSNAGMITVGVLFVVVAGLRATGAIDWIAGAVLGRPKSLRGALVRVILPVQAVSAFLNNTPVVAMLIPAVSDWARRLQISPSKLLIPLSYAAILGGTCSLIGTSTNLVVSGMVIAHSDLPPIRMFDITWIGLPTAIIGGAFLVLAGPRLLPGRISAGDLLKNPREYTGEMVVPAGSPMAGKSVEEAGLRNLPGAYLVEIEREGEIIAAVGPDQRLRAEDRLVFAGVVESLKDLQNLRGLAPATNQVFKIDSPRHQRRIFEAVVSNACPLVGQTIKEGRFRTVYGAAVLAVARNGERLSGRIGDIRLRAGDTLLIEAGERFEDQQRNSREFFLVKALEDSTPRRHERAPLALGILVLMVAVAALEWLDMLHAAMLAAGLMIMTRCCSINDARRQVEWSVLIVIGAALGLGAALDQSGAASALAQGVLALAGKNPWLVLAAVYLATSLLTEVVTNNAAVALMFPFAQATAEHLGVNFLPFVFAIMMAGSASFATPLGYQTNLMVYGPGGYRFGDFLRIGVPMNVLVAIISILLIPMIWPL